MIYTFFSTVFQATKAAQGRLDKIDHSKIASIAPTLFDETHIERAIKFALKRKPRKAPDSQTIQLTYYILRNWYRNSRASFSTRDLYQIAYRMIRLEYRMGKHELSTADKIVYAAAVSNVNKRTLTVEQARWWQNAVLSGSILTAAPALGEMVERYRSASNYREAFASFRLNLDFQRLVTIVDETPDSEPAALKVKIDAWSGKRSIVK